MDQPHGDSTGTWTDPAGEQQWQLRLALDIAGLAAWSIDLESGEERWFAGSDELFGVQLGPGPLGPRIQAAMMPQHRQEAAENLARARAEGRGFTQRYQLRDSSGHQRWMQSKAQVHLIGDPPRRTLVGVTRDITALVKSRGELEERAETEAERATEIQELAGSLLAATTVDEVAGAIAERFFEGIDAIGAVVLVPEHGKLRALASSGAGVAAGRVMDGLPVTAAVPAARVIQENRAYYVRSHEEFLALSGGDPHRLLSLTAARSWAMLPLSRGDRAPGALILGYARRHTFPIEEQTLLLALAGLTGQALERSALLQARIDLAGAVQHVLLPERLPEVAGLRLAARYLPARDGVTVGGDWYDVLQLPDGRCALSIGDVEGHDVESAATMGQVRTALRAFAQSGKDPGEILAATNTLLHSLASPLLSTCTYTVLDLERGELTAATAGHVPGVVGLAGGQTRLLAPPPGPPLGVLPDAEYPNHRQPLAGVETLTLMTDGLLEGPGLCLDDGLDLVRAAVTRSAGRGPEQLADALLAAASAVDHRDDAALLTLRLD
ncbi:PP2C family protein-serine/threonine phosphatase [Kitasatospora kifunensis]|uniref:Serine phosphatase RsbU (Regulator of sigma subunit) n=1 Tax=Kitasatospora kifunensis TaxID=58351 RepID=A0A7W7R996_KITKI|nr:PP2C family protein-serine/threonine phosphatase [Kitasatospora kifunensis]MBB4927664.1 serine phosphatase RsbU (regulator of sigma subunit) [Kitasatospora kifunensis]